MYLIIKTIKLVSNIRSKEVNIMVIEYLEKIHHQMYEEKIRLEREYQKKEVSLNDTLKFIHTLEDSLDENFESFTPWKVYHENHSKIDFLKEKQTVIESEMKNLKNKIELYDNNIAELLEILEYTRNDLLIKNDATIINSDNTSNNIDNVSRETNNFLDKNNTFACQKIIDSMMQEFDKIYRKVENCAKFIEVDIPRSRIELQTLSKQVYETIQKYNKQMH